jgi:heptose-I-phosphate ethanolaminephosphotransferase
MKSNNSPAPEGKIKRFRQLFLSLRRFSSSKGNISSNLICFFYENQPRIAIWLITVIGLFLLFLADMFCWYEIWSRVTLGGYYYSCKNAALVALFFASPILIFKGKYLRIYPQVLFAILTPLIAAECYCRLTFQMFLSGSIIAIILESNRQEILDFCSGMLSFKFIILIILSIIAFSGFCYFVWKTSSRIKNNVFLFFLGILSIIPMLWSMTVAVYSNQNFIYSRITPLGRTAFISFIHSCVRETKHMREVMRKARTPIFPEDVHRTWKDDSAIGVIVVGESACRNYWGLYGYERNTTPELSKRKDEIIKFTDCISAYNSTGNALKYLFTQCTIDAPDNWKCTLSQLYQHCGWETGLISSNSHWGEWDTFGNLVWSGTDYSLYLQEHNAGKGCFDGDLLDFIQQYLSEPLEHSRLLFVHLQGSHSPYTLYPTTWQCPFGALTKQQNKQNLYDNSIAYTDELLGGILTLLESLNIPSFFVFISDHGETPKAPGKSFRVANDMDCWEIPFVIWFSKQYKKMHPELVEQIYMNSALPIQSDQLFYGLAQLGGIQTEDFDSKQNIFSASFIPKNERPLPTINQVYSSVNNNF